jgi:hypothetical protein
MAFVNEYISEEDWKKYDIDGANKKFPWGVSFRDWTIDRNRDVYLRQVGSGREEFYYQSTWTLYWHGNLLRVELETISATGSRGGPCSAHERIRSIHIPLHLQEKRDQIMTDLYDALVAHKDGGVLATATTYTLTLDV